MGEKTEQVCKTAIERRYRLLPYIYTLFREASTVGMPVMRPAFWADLTNPELRSEQHTYMLGGDLLIMPRFAEGCKIPGGDWDLIPFEGNGVDDGFQAHVALRSGAIVPLANVYQNTVEYKTDSLTLIVNPDGNGYAQGRLYEDAGDGFGYRHGEYAEYELTAHTAGKQVTVAITKVAGNQESKKRMLRVGIVADGKITYSPWKAGDTVTMKTVKDKEDFLDVSKLPFRPLSNDYKPGSEKDIRIGNDQLVK